MAGSHDSKKRPFHGAFFREGIARLTNDSPDSQQRFKDAKALIVEGRYEDALRLTDEILETTPDAAEALYMKAVCERYLKRMDAALETLRALKSAAPEFGRGAQEEGHVLRALGRPEEALAAYREACRFNPALEASWRAQAELLKGLARTREADAAAQQAASLARLPKPLLTVSHLMHEGRLLQAEKLCRAFMQKNPRHVEGMRLLAQLGVKFSVYDDAEFLLESALEFEPDNLGARIDYISVLRKRQKFADAHKLTRALHEAKPDDVFFQSQLAIDCMNMDDYETALSLFDDILTKVPDDPSTLVSRGHALKTQGRHEAAVASYRAAYGARPSLGDAYYGLANLKTYRFTEDEVALMQTQETSGRLPYAHRIQLCFSLGKAFEDEGDYEKSFAYYNKGNDLKRVQCRYDADEMERELQIQAEICDASLFEKQSGKGFAVPDPIFIVGLPRAGSTLLEQILASHSEVDGTFELPYILAMAHRLRRSGSGEKGTPYPQALHHMDKEALSGLGEKFIEDTRIHRAGAPYFIDKMPNNFRHVGLIHLILPNAKIIDARREPMACCFSGFKQLFAEGQEFTYGLENIGRYYRDYVDLMRHWDEALPGKVLRVQHEDVLDDLETQVRRMLDFCGLPFEQACLDFHKTERAVRTASSEQVRQPINKAGVDQWRRFEPYLGPLKDALGPALSDYR